MEYETIETTIKRNEVILKANAGGLVRPLDARNLLKIGAEWINNLYIQTKDRSINQPFVIDVVILKEMKNKGLKLKIYKKN